MVSNLAKTSKSNWNYCKCTMQISWFF